MENKGWNQIRLVVGIIGVFMLIFLRLSGVLSIIDTCLCELWFAVFVLATRNLQCLPWTFGLTVFYASFLFLGYHFPLLEWDAPSLNFMQKAVLYGNQLAILLVNAFFYFCGIVALIFLICAVLSGFDYFKQCQADR